MQFTDPYVRQHNELIDTAKKISEFLDVHKLTQNIAEVHFHLSILSRALNAHLLMEDRGLYPIMLEHENTVAKELARLYIDEMGDLKSTFVEYVITWKENKIQDNPERFIIETKKVFDALTKRVEKENTVLYPFVEKLFFGKKNETGASTSEEELAARLEVDRMRASRGDSEIKRKIIHLINEAEMEIFRQKKRWFFRNYETAIKYYREAYLLGHIEAKDKIQELTKKN